MHVYDCMYVCMYLCTCMYVCMYVRMYVCMYVCIYACMDVCICRYLVASNDALTSSLYTKYVLNPNPTPHPARKAVNL